jgi:hypothetical protein
MKTSQTLRLTQILLLAGFTAGVNVSIAAGSVKLTGAQEVPAVDTAATGMAGIVVRPDKTVSGSIKTTGIEGTMAHIHVGEPGKNGPPIVTLVKSGDNTWSVPDGTKLSDEQYQEFKDGKLYVNVHSDSHKGGEIRTQLKP